MSDDDRLLATKDRAAARFLTMPGVTAVGLGGRERDGRPTGEIVLKVFVARKRPAAELPPGELLPDQFEGVGVDVAEMGPGVLDGPPPPVPGSPLTADNATDDTRYRPVKGGGRVQVDLTGKGFGTLGCILTDTADPKKIYALTNYHVVGPRFGSGQIVAGQTRVGQPTNQSAPTKCCNDIIGVYVAGRSDVNRDAVLVQLAAGTEWLAEIIDIGPVAGSATVSLAQAVPLDYQVRKRGQRTGLTGGVVEAVNTTHTVQDPTVQGGTVTRTNVMVVRPNPNAAVPAGRDIFFTSPGDSGSAVVNASNEVVALHFAGGPVSGGLHRGLELPIADVIAQFQSADHVSVAVATATANGVVNTVPAAPAPGPAPAPAPGSAGPRVPAEAALMTGPSYPDALSRLGTDLEASDAGRRLRALWFEHHEELLDLVGHRRRVTVAWHRDGGPALLHRLIRMAADPELTMPPTVNGQPPLRQIRHLHAVLHANASPPLRIALDSAIAALPDPAALTYDQMLAALATR